MPVAPMQLGVHFIVSTDTTKANADTRKFIRSHVMMGKNLGKSRPRKKNNANKGKAKEVPPPSDNDAEHVEQDSPPTTTEPETLCGIPARVGSDIDFNKFADFIKPSVLDEVIKFSREGKKILFPLEPCFAFDHNSRMWWDALSYDPAYLNTTAFMSHAYVNMMRGYRGNPIGQDGTYHLVKTVHHLRERLSAGPGPLLFQDSTIFIILMLAVYAHVMGEGETAQQHMKGLRRIVNMRGGIRTTDLGIALHNGVTPIFFLDNPFAEPLIPYPDNSPHLVAQGVSKNIPPGAEKFFSGINPKLKESWQIMKVFSVLMNVTAESQKRLPQTILLNTMTSTMYRLLDMKFNPDTINEAIRLGLLAFCSHIFLRWQSVKLNYTHLPNIYKSSLVNLKFSKDFPPHVMLWLLTVGAISIFAEEDDVWLKPWLRVNFELCEIHSWRDMKEKLKDMMWVELVQDEAGEGVYNSCATEGLRVQTI
ncbi:hypothetical protein H072_10845 [Dactylellina haptotyla CBS 200.50]|uniref:Transcription factor domain-containing protein n=1 Tax=Dactylellina haptotyla (strain CBS 200.50) TaxID=1284197 RepID=S7ZY61_DACHA|nr:hypothetical protein H072_10845 [Dactylellina haptotyla CBS 200.50]